LNVAKSFNYFRALKLYLKMQDHTHACYLVGVFIDDVKVLVSLSFGLSGPNEVAMKLAVRSDDPEVSDKIHETVGSG
jgi:coatomer subunit gamma